ncbi:hypothetical protein H257_06737 [Aphanomyces astaci]|uniref:Core-binding (CB) domain-containing protein n=1 Tax=Aphanomyces astaci TaxID=112090 RepID=W4GM69_APHAT|nr:hypothetical protein H257_06737 [Aphanomyces astaci]ETV80466.1 hypothetical protein H257_06737 [Aphanomyces astaci]|eukprot:XP_009830390.1 hypothetical protein H257_06737 [Aphanomyces astaci]
MGRTKRKHNEDASEAVAGYTSILERFKRWLLCEHREFVVDSVIQLPLSTTLCHTYLDYASIKRDATGSELVPKRFNSFSTIGTCKSALKYLYKEANLKMHDDLDARLKGLPSKESSTLLFGVNAKARFSKWLLKVCASNEAEIVAMDMSFSDIGTHSFRKGVATSLSNTPGGPQAVSIWLHAGWSLGSVQGRYVFEGSGGDQFVGRAATGLQLSSSAFGALPPHIAALALEEWEKYLPDYATEYPACFRCVLPYLLASLALPHEWLKVTFSPGHPLFMSTVWRSGKLNPLWP